MKITAKSKLHGVELGDELAAAMSQAMAEEIDWGILCGLMTQVGWHKVTASTQYSMDDYAMVKEWLNKHIKGHYKCRFNTWIFERSEDAMWFSIRWS
jgi:hypothetical protein